MVRQRHRVSKKGLFTQDQIKKGLELVKNGSSYNAAAKQVGVDRKTLQRYSKYMNSPEQLSSVVNSKFNHGQVFTAALESELSRDIAERSDLGYGLTKNQVQELAYGFAKGNGLKYPATWDVHQKAGCDWYYGFMKRNSDLVSRKPEQCSMARAASFNKPVMETYFKKLENVLSRHPNFLNGSRIFNADETATSTVAAQRDRIICQKGVKQVHLVKGQERGVNVTTCSFICSNGYFLPPVMIFPRKNVNTGMGKDAYPGSLILAHQTGWMTKEMFFKTMQHFIDRSFSSNENPSLLIFDNVETHLSSDTIRLCKENGVVLFTLPPHTTHKTQPLDVGVYGPFKAAYNKAVKKWTDCHAGIPASIYEVAGFVNTATVESMTPSNILAAFKSTGINPFNKNIFPDEAFKKSEVTFQGIPEEKENNQNEENLQESPIQPSTSSEIIPNTPSSSEQNSEKSPHVSPKEIIPHPKRKEITSKGKPRRKGKSAILTDTPEKDEIERREAERKEKEDKKNQRKKERQAKVLKDIVEEAMLSKRKKKKQKGQSPPRKRSKGEGKTRVKRALEFSVSSDSDEAENISQDSSECSEEEEERETITTGGFSPLAKKPEEGEYILVEFGKQTKFYYIGKVLKEEDEDGDLEVSYLRRSLNVKGKFTLPNVPDLKSVHKRDVKMILPVPVSTGTKRQQHLLQFDIDFSFINVK